MELVHYHLVHGCQFAISEGQVGEHFRGAADYGRVRVDGGVTRQHADIFRPERAQRSKNFSETSALIGALYHERRPEASMERWAHSATRLLPEPVGVATMT